MGNVYKFSDQADLIAAVNAVITNGDPCTPSSPLTPPTKPVIFKPSSDSYAGWQDIRDAIDAYAAANNTSDNPCGPLTWNNPPDLTNKIWKQNTLDEINSNLAIIAACTCGCSDEANMTCRADNGNMIVLETLASDSYCSGCVLSAADGVIDQFSAALGEVLDPLFPNKLVDIIGSMHISPSGCQNRSWTLHSSVISFGVTKTFFLAGGTIDCNGNVVYTGSALSGIPSSMKINVGTGLSGLPDCTTFDCSNVGAIAIRDNTSSLSIYLVINSASATCQKC